MHNFYTYVFICTKRQWVAPEKVLLRSTIKGHKDSKQVDLAWELKFKQDPSKIHASPYKDGETLREKKYGMLNGGNDFTEIT